MLELRSLCCGYGSVSAVSDLSLSVKPGGIHGLLGPNGAGKTSTVMAVMGHVTIRSGLVVLDGEDITSLAPEGRTARGLSVVPEGRRLFGDLTTHENLLVGGYRTSMSATRRNLERVYSFFPRLSERRTQMCSSMSGGEQQMVAFGRALMAEPRVLLVDELSLGLMPKAVGVFVEVLHELRRQGVGILLVDQNTARVLQVSDEITLMATGRTVFSGPPSSPEATSNLFRSFVGGSA